MVTALEGTSLVWDLRPFAAQVDPITPLAGMAFRISASCMRAGEGTRAVSPGEP